MEAIRKFAINDFQKQRFVEPPPDRYDILTIRKDTSAFTAYSPASQHILHSLRQDMFVQKSLASIHEIAHTASQDPPLLLIRVPFEPPIPVHKFYAASEDVLTLMRIAQIDDCGLGLVSNDTTGFHCLTPGNITAGGMGDMNDEEKGETPASYYIYCGAYKLVWSHNPRTKCTKAVAFMYKSGRGLDGFEDFVSSLLRDAEMLVTHPLFIPLLAGMETVSFMEKTLRSQYDQCRIAEKNSGVHPWRLVDVTEQGDTVRELAEMSRRMTALVVEVEMVLRRLRQWKLALHDFTNIIELYEKQGYRSTPEHHGLVANAISLTQSKLGTMEIDFVYVNARAKNQVSAVSIPLLCSYCCLPSHAHDPPVDHPNHVQRRHACQHRSSPIRRTGWRVNEGRRHHDHGFPARHLLRRPLRRALAPVGQQEQRRRGQLLGLLGLHPAPHSGRVCSLDDIDPAGGAC
jgi:hypothetical protein